MHLLYKSAPSPSKSESLRNWNPAELEQITVIYKNEVAKACVCVCARTQTQTDAAEASILVCDCGGGGGGGLLKRTNNYIYNNI